MEFLPRKGFKTINHGKYIIKKYIVDIFSRCHFPSETIDHITNGCLGLANNPYLSKHNLAVKIVHIKFALKHKLLDNSPPYYKYQPEELGSLNYYRQIY